MRIGIIAALPGELKALVRGWDRLPAARGSGIAMWQKAAEGGCETIAACGGIGAAAARRAFAAVEFHGAIDLVLSIGWAGALVEEVRPGKASEVYEVVDVQTGERFAMQGGSLRLVTTPQVAHAAEKQRLAASYGAALVDMEAAPVARLAQMRGIPMRCFKAVSDGLDAKLPDLNPFIDVAGKMRMGKFLGHVLVRPGYWLPLAQLGRNSAVASRALSVAINGFLESAGS